MLQKSSIALVLGVFFRSPHKEHYLMEISRKIHIAHTSVKKNLQGLANAGIVQELIEKRGRRRFPIYKANTENKNFKRFKFAYNISSLLESNLIDFIAENLMPKSIVLFGSYRRGEDAEESDIDLFVECGKEEIDLKAFEKKLGRKIELHFNENFNSYPAELKNNIINGIVLSGFLEGFS